MAASAQAETCVRVRLFAALRESMGWSERLVTPATAASTPLALWHELGLGPEDRTPDDQPPSGIRVAINQQFACWDAPLTAGDELAFMPPISGG